MEDPLLNIEKKLGEIAQNAEKAAANTRAKLLASSFINQICLALVLERGGNADDGLARVEFMADKLLSGHKSEPDLQAQITEHLDRQIYEIRRFLVAIGGSTE